ncbi:uncharacterized protein BDZ99DRAFT_562129 [Mytilinidion resinicola]|uniref:Uncharacterized protein n=1 Tax=Mytilinidion resinicola TaxID=574789 RepID=A0A6A6YQH3_9PEZI|nr:uncharacterized protein BDZ99DRAFT_562129 [Mytilinidion resinicola]KAF2811156.1 hypothetical protein BDZ99DRAFT_562129 [Mytilinidion resinicola]
MIFGGFVARTERRRYCATRSLGIESPGRSVERDSMRERDIGERVWVRVEYNADSRNRGRLLAVSSVCFKLDHNLPLEATLCPAARHFVLFQTHCKGFSGVNAKAEDSPMNPSPVLYLLFFRGASFSNSHPLKQACLNKGKGGTKVVPFLHCLMMFLKVGEVELYVGLVVLIRCPQQAGAARERAGRPAWQFIKTRPFYQGLHSNASTGE